jgi:hypothetical protein
MSRIPAPWRNSAYFPFVRQNFIPLAGGAPLFYDTCAGLHQAFTGTAFSPAQDEAFDHLHCATYVDQVELGGVNLKESHQAVYENPELAREIRTKQDAYYASRQPKENYALRTRH